MAFPTTSSVDNFNRANETPLAGNWSQPIHTSGGSNRINLTSNQVASAVAGSADAYWNVANFGPDCEAILEIATKSSATADWAVYVRIVNVGVGTADGYRLLARAESGTDIWELQRLDNGTATVLASATGPEFAAGDAIGVEMIGSTLKGYHRTGGVWSEILSTTDGTYTGAGRIGFQLISTGNRGDNFAGGTVVAGGTEHFGAASLDLTTNITVAAKKDAHAASANPLTLTLAAAGARDAHAAATVPLAVNVSAAAVRDAHAATATPLAFNIAAQARKDAHAAVDMPLTFGIATDGTIAITGAASLNLNFDFAAAARKNANAAVAVPLTLDVTTEATSHRYGAAAVPLTLNIGTSSTTTGYGAAALPIEFNIVTVGRVPSPSPNLDPVLTGWIAPTVPPSIGGGSRGRVAAPDSGSIA